jgi:hypothetical protein
MSSQLPYAQQGSGSIHMMEVMNHVKVLLKSRRRSEHSCWHTLMRLSRSRLSIRIRGVCVRPATPHGNRCLVWFLLFGLCALSVFSRSCVTNEPQFRAWKAQPLDISDPANAYVYVSEAQTTHIWIDVCACM